MVEKFEKILNSIKKDRGSLTLFAIVKMDELTDRWTIILSASWVTDDSKTELFNYIRDLLIKNLTEEELKSMARIGLFSVNEYLVQVFLKSIQSHAGTMRLQDSKINGYSIHDAYIFESNNIAVEA
jgi:hypothetical protein